ncbi:MAG TPA: purine-nucleoside phosphorylase, partial [Runella sp.]|nr:purine-nucleoside phosphorylase [Runella sp.]
MEFSHIQEAVDFLKNQTQDFQPQVGIILGTGLGSLVDDITIQASISYETIPHFPVSTVESHKGKLLFGTLSGKKVVCMQGRFHYYEGYSMQQVSFPVR